jgi:ankyrin repeat protein
MKRFDASTILSVWIFIILIVAGCGTPYTNLVVHGRMETDKLRRTAEFLGVAGSAAQMNEGTFYFNNHPFRLCYAFLVPGKWRLGKDDLLRSEVGNAEAGVWLYSAQELEGLEGPDLVTRATNFITKVYEKRSGRPLASVQVQPFQSSLPGTVKWSASLGVAEKPGGRFEILAHKVFAEIAPGWVAQITVGGTSDDNGLFQHILETLRTTAQPECYMPFLRQHFPAEFAPVQTELPLVLAARDGHIDTVKALLDKGADVNAKADKGFTALQAAAASGHTEIVRLLLARGADVNAVGFFGSNPLRIAAWNGHFDTVRTLLAQGADVNARENAGETALLQMGSKGYLPIVQLLLEHGADVNARDNKDRTPLMGAAQAGKTDLVRLLLTRGVDVDARGENGGTALIYAAFHGHVDTVRTLLHSGADVRVIDKAGFTALMWAVQNSHTPVAELLKKAGAKE